MREGERKVIKVHSSLVGPRADATEGAWAEGPGMKERAGEEVEKKKLVERSFVSFSLGE